jgi:hypothetical protein
MTVTVRTRQACFMPGQQEASETDGLTSIEAGPEAEAEDGLNMLDTSAFSG